MLHLRAITTDDAARITAWKQDPLVTTMAMDHDYTTNEDEQRADIESAISDTEQEYTIIMHDNDAIGYIRINWMDTEQTKAWLRFALGTMRGNGYTEIALRQYLRSLQQNGCMRVEAEVYATNIASQKILKKLGFLVEGQKRKAHYTGTEHIDVFVYGLLMDELR